MSEHLVSRLRLIGEMFDDLVQRETCPRGRGLLLGFSMRNAAHAAQVVKLARERGVLFLTAGHASLRFVPSLNVQQEQIDEAMDVLESALVVLRESI